MQKKLKNILIDLSLLGVVFFILFLFHAVFIAGPLRAQEHEERLFVNEFASRYNLKDVEVMNRFALDEPYFIIKSEDKLHAFNTSFSKVFEHDFVPFDKVEAKAIKKGFSASDIKYGVFSEKIVFSLESSKQIVLIDMDSLEVVFE